MLWEFCTQRVRYRGAQLACLTGLAAARVIREGCSARRVLHVAVRSSGFELDHATARSGSDEKRDRGELEN